MTANSQVSVFPGASAAVYVTRVVPMVKVSPLVLSAVSVTDPELSVAVGSDQVAGALSCPAVVLTMMSAGQLVITGLSVSVHKNGEKKSVYF